MAPFKSWRLLIWLKSVNSRISARAFLFVFATATLALLACNRTSDESGVYPVNYHPSSLPNVMLTDQYGRPVALASLKGKPVLFDFIYTSCPGPCQLLTQHMKLIAISWAATWGRKCRLFRSASTPSTIAQTDCSTMREHSTPMSAVGFFSPVRRVRSTS